MKIQIKKVSPRLPEVHEVDFGSTEPIDDVSRIKRYAPRIFGSGQLAAGLNTLSTHIHIAVMRNALRGSIRRI